MKGNYLGVIVIVLLLAAAGVYVFDQTYSSRNHPASVVSPAPESTDLTNLSTYSISDNGRILKFSYPKEVTVAGKGIGYSTEWQNQATTSGLVLATAILPKAYQPKTNFSNARFTVGTSADVDAVINCVKGPVSLGIQKTKVTIRGVSYAKIMYTDAGAGNLYETTSYRTVHNAQCYSVEYTIHSTNLGNYSPEQGITAYDKQKVIDVMESMVQSTTFL